MKEPITESSHLTNQDVKLLHTYSISHHLLYLLCRHLSSIIFIMTTQSSLSTRSPYCRCTKGCPADLPIVFLKRSHKYTVRDPCVCQPNNLICANQNKNICTTCHRAHRLDAHRRPEYSTFSCQ